MFRSASPLGDFVVAAGWALVVRLLLYCVWCGAVPGGSFADVVLMSVLLAWYEKWLARMML